MSNLPGNVARPTYIRVHPVDQNDPAALLVQYDNGQKLSEADYAGPVVPYCVYPDHPDSVYVCKNAFRKEGWITEANFEELIEKNEATEVAPPEEANANLNVGPDPTFPAVLAEVDNPTESSDIENPVGEVEAEQNAQTDSNQATKGDVDAGVDSTPISDEPETVNIAEVADGGCSVFPPIHAAQVSAPAPEPDSEAVVKLAAPVTVDGPHFRESDHSPFDVRSSRASYIYGFDAANNAVVLRNAFGNRRAPYIVRPPLASNEAALAERLHGKSGEELKARVRGTAKRTGPATPLVTWTEMISAFTIFPDLLDELNLDDDGLDTILKLLHNGGFMKSQKADHHGVYFQIADASALEIEVRGQGKLPWVFVGLRDPDELLRLALLVKLLNYKAIRRGSLRSGSITASPSEGGAAE